MMKRLKTLRVRFALWTAGLLLAALTAFGGFIYFSFAQSLYTARDNTLQLNAEQTIATLDNEDGTIHLSNEFSPGNTGEANTGEANTEEAKKEEARRERGLTLFLYDPVGTLLQSSGPNPSLSVPAAGLAAAP